MSCEMNQGYLTLIARLTGIFQHFFMIILTAGALWVLISDEMQGG